VAGESEREATTGTELTLWSIAKQLLQFVGIVGGGGGGFAALAFGIGYFATKNHDAMLGLPTTTTSYVTYVRTGALFFPLSLHYLVTSLLPFRWGVLVLAVLVAGISVLFRKSLKSIRKRLRSHERRLQFIMMGQVVLIMLCAIYLPFHVAPLHPANRGLLFMDHKPPSDAHYALKIHTLLRKEEGEETLHRFYGYQCSAVIALAYAIILLARWRGAVHETARADAVSGNNAAQTPKGLAGESYLRNVSAWLLEPLLYLVVAILVITLPANYGVISLSNDYPCVRLSVLKSGDAEKLEPANLGYLLTDLSAEPPEVVVLSRVPGGSMENPKYVHTLFKREAIRKIEVTSCGPTNVLSQDQ
jgi:hypothetical protein